MNWVLLWALRRIIRQPALAEEVRGLNKCCIEANVAGHTDVVKFGATKGYCSTCEVPEQPSCARQRNELSLKPTDRNRRPYGILLRCFARRTFQRFGSTISEILRFDGMAPNL